MQLTLDNLTKLVEMDDKQELKKCIHRAKELAEKYESIIEEKLDEVLTPVPKFNQAIMIHFNQVTYKFYSGIAEILENEDISNQEKLKRLKGLFELSGRVSETFTNPDFTKGYKEGYEKANQFYVEILKEWVEITNKYLDIKPNAMGKLKEALEELKEK